MKYRTKIILIVISLCILVNTLFILFFLYSSKNRSIEMLHNKIATNSQLLNQVNSGSLYDGDILKLKTNLKSFLNDPEIVSISLQEFQGNISLNFDKANSTHENILKDETTITYNGEKVGSITTRYTTNLIDNQFASYLRIVLICYSVVALFLTFSLYLLLKKITKPIQDLTDLSIEIANGNLEKDIAIVGDNEIGILSQSLLTMRDSIKNTIHSLKVENQERRLAENELKEAKSYIDNIINSMPSILVGVDNDHRVTQWNKQAEKFSSISFQNAKDRTIEELLPHLANKLDQIDKAIKNRKIFHANGCETKTDKSIRYEDIIIFPLVDDVTSGAVIQIEDVTEQYEIRNELAHSRKLEAIGQLAGGVAHDFNNMLTGILGAAELLRNHQEDDPKAQKYLNMIVQSGQRAGDLTNKLLTYARKGKVESTSVSVAKAINEAVSILQHSLDKRVSIAVSIKAEKTSIIGDLSQIQNALINLGVNGGLAMPEGGTLSFSLDQIYLDETYCNSSPFEILAGQYLDVKIRDTGIGIPDENINQIFEPFFTTRQQGGGSGLGLAAVYGTVQQHNGAITVNSEEGSGTLFNIYLPLSNKALLSKTLSDETPITGSGKILVVDDEEVIRSTAKGILEHLEYEVLLAEDGQQGLDIFRSEHESIDLVIVDMIMPTMNGQKCFYAMKAIQPDVRVILASGYTRDTDLGELKKDGLKGFLRKPYTTTQLSKAIVLALEDFVE